MFYWILKFFNDILLSSQQFIFYWIIQTGQDNRSKICCFIWKRVVKTLSTRTCSEDFVY